MDMIDRISVVPATMEQYISFNLSVAVNKVDNDPIEDSKLTRNMKICFIDSFAFMNRSLSELTNLLTNEEFKILPDEIVKSQTSSESWLKLLRRAPKQQTFDALIRKGVYPYDHIVDLSVFEETEFPSYDAFYSKLTDSNISASDYDHAKHVWQLFNIQSLGEYHDLYLCSDVLLLADLFENFRSTCQESYNLDPAHYITVASFSFDACLKMTNVSLDVISDPETHLFIESGVRGGLSQISHRMSKANNVQAAIDPVMDIDPNKPTSYIIYLGIFLILIWTYIYIYLLIIIIIIITQQI